MDGEVVMSKPESETADGRMRTALEEIAKQQLRDEMDRWSYAHSDFVGAYDAIIKVAREALS